MAERRDDLQHHLGGEGVHPVGPVQRQQRDALLLVEANLVEAHPSLSLPLLQGRKRRRRRQALVDVNVKISARAPERRRMKREKELRVGKERGSTDGSRGSTDN